LAWTKQPEPWLSKKAKKKMKRWWEYQKASKYFICRERKRKKNES